MIKILINSAHIICWGGVLLAAIILLLIKLSYGNGLWTTVVTVGEGEKYSDIQSAMDAVVFNNYFHRYIIDVMPGEYDISNADIPYIGLKNYVFIVGRDKGSCIVKNIKSDDTYNSAYSAFDAAKYRDFIKEAAIENLTIVTKGCKAPIHIDTGYSHFMYGGTVTIDNCNLIDLNYTQMEGFPEYSIEDYAGGVNVGLRSGQTVIVKNVNSNGCIYAHNGSDQNSKRSGAHFEIINCRFEMSMLGDLGSGANDTALIQGCKFKTLVVNSIEQSGEANASYSWNITLENNQIDRIVGMTSLDKKNEQLFWDTYFGGTFGINDSSIHNFCYNSGDDVIERGTWVQLSSYYGGELLGTGVETLCDDGELYGYALEDIKPDCFGIIQYSGVIRLPASDLQLTVGERYGVNKGELVCDDEGKLQVIEENGGYYYLRIAG